MNFNRIGRLALAALLTAGSLATHAGRTAFELRYFQLDNHLQDGGGAEGEDGFANGDPYTGMRYSAPGKPPSGGWPLSIGLHRWRLADRGGAGLPWHAVRVRRAQVSLRRRHHHHQQPHATGV